MCNSIYMKQNSSPHCSKFKSIQLSSGAKVVYCYTVLSIVTTQISTHWINIITAVWQELFAEINMHIVVNEQMTLTLNRTK